MFWGLVLEPGKRYSTTVDKSFHVSMAALDCSSVKFDSEILSVLLESDGQENILCNLSKQQKLLQCHLDLNFMTGDKVAFEIKGNGIVHLSGYLVPEDDDDDYMNMQDFEDDDVDEEEEEDEEEGPPTKNDKGKQKRKRKAETPKLKVNKEKKLKMSENSDEDSDEEDEDEDEEETDTPIAQMALENSEDEDEEEDDDSDEEEDDDSDEDADDSDEEEEEVPAVQTKKQQKTLQSPNKKVQQTPNNKQTPSNKQQQSANKQNATPLMNGSGPNQQGSNKKNKKKGNQGQETPKTPVQNDVKGKNQKTPGSETESPAQQKKKLEGGILIKDLKEGTGPVAKSGQMVSVYYQGKLKNNNKVFDECKRGGPAFRFRLGKGEVIKGWDIGVSGMKVGGIRTITCPPNMAYGQKGSPPQIPPNSALVFQVELKAVN